ncbi:MAG: efflux RND transporter periplasmic adaptor subunit [Thermodesulfobacteriota bacterium]
MKKTWIAIGLVSLTMMTAFCGKEGKPVIEKSAVVEGVRIETVKSSPVASDYEAVGTVRSRTTSVLSSKRVGHVMAVHVREGDRVRIGQVLIDIDDRDARAELQKAQAGLREVEEAQEEAEQNIRAAESAKEAAEAGRSLARVTFNRYRALLEEKSASQQEFDEVQAKLRVAEAEVDRAEKVLQALIAKKKQVQAKMDQAKADITTAQVHVGYSQILCPLDGIVASKQAEVGLLAAPGVPLLTLEDHAHYRLEASVEDSMLKNIRLESPVRISIDAIGPQEFPCRVTEVVPASDPGSRSSTVKIDLFDGKGGLIGHPILRSGLFGKARFKIGEKEGLLVPQKAVFHRGQLVAVFVLDASNLLRLRLIQIGKQYADRVEVLSGLNEGERIVVEGVDRVKEGARVQ